MEPAILIVDDDVDTCANLSDILTDLGYRIDITHNGLEALELVQQTHHDVVLLDFKMPGMDGLTLYQEIKKIHPGIVAFMVTAFASGDTAEVAHLEGVWDILRKPVELPVLLPLIDGAVNQPLLLVVDDDIDFCESMWDILHEKSYRICLAHDLKKASECMQHKAHDIMLLDLKLSDSNGSDVLELAKKMNPDCRIILITGFRTEMDQTIQQLIKGGADEVFYKPLNLSNLLNMLESLSKTS
ncbi:response regulator [Gimesia maris]|jgi:DNA-binding NtrC family response regulator|uniref:response regulator n=1 Tax=Gimesia maris TaxID=122 RepID=UPI0030DC8E2D|tara:strand:+ start:2153 stop:2878 length:726 start_codon:yes stop_codon:yes gene_type:complete